MSKPDTGPNRFTGEDLSAKQMKQIVELGSEGRPKSYMFSAEELARFCGELVGKQREIMIDIARINFKDIDADGVDLTPFYNSIKNAPEPEL